MKLFFVVAFLIAQVYSQNLWLDQKCGQGTNGKIVGGQVADKGSWGWHAAMEYNNYILCGGALINNQWVVTAAHCMVGGTNPASYKIHVGLHDKNFPDSYTKRIAVTRVIVHPNYSASTVKNDIALLKLGETVALGDKIEAVCVPDGTDQYGGKMGWASGFGTTSAGGSLSRYKMEVQLPIGSDSSCRQQWYLDPATQVCAGKTGLNKDTCQGDSGGPLVVKGSNGRWHLIGVTSYGSANCLDGGVYTRISAFKDWIVSNIRY